MICMHCFDFQKLSSTKDSSITVQGTVIVNSDVKVLKLSTSSQSNSVEQLVTISDLRYTNWTFLNDGDLLVFSNIESESVFEITLKNLVFENLIFTNGGNLMHFQHQIDAPLNLLNVTVTNVYNAGMLIASFDKGNTDTITKVTARNIFATNIDGNYASFITMNEGSFLQIFDSEFSFISNLQAGAVINAAEQRTTVEIYDSSFYNNTSVEGAVMNAENRGIIKAYNSNFTNNFAFGSGVIKAVNDGSYELFSWNLTDNYAYYAPVSEIFSTTTFSKINNCRISRNIVLSKEDIFGSFLKQSKYSFINFLSVSKL
jgi:hypothetical protein